MKFQHTLMALLAATLSATAASPTVIYETGWEASPASPAWAVGIISGQNGWIGHTNAQVVENGSPQAVIGGQAVATPTGSRFHKFIANSAASTTRETWFDFSSAFNSRPTGQNVVKASMDMFVPASQTGIPGLYGMGAYHGGAQPWGALVDPSDRSINILFDGGIPFFVGNLIAFDTWFTLTITANFDTGDVNIALDGEDIPALAFNTAFIVENPGLTDVDLVAASYATAEVTGVRSVCSDNYRIITEDAAVALPTLTIAPTPPDGASWTLSWPEAFANWILESSDVIAEGNWTPETNPTTIAGGVVSMEVADAPPVRFFRLRQPPAP